MNEYLDLEYCFQGKTKDVFRQLNMLKVTAVWLASLLFITNAWANISLEIKGLDGALKTNVDAYLSAISEQDYSTSLRFQSRLRDNISNALRALGYYQPEIQFVVSEDQKLMTITINRGEPVIIEESDIHILGMAREDEEFIQLVEKSGLNKGETLDHGKYDSLKSSLRNLALSKGYFNGDFSKSVLEVSPELGQAFVHLHYKSGVRFRFGDTIISGSQIELEKVRSLIPYKKGDPYLSSDVGLFNQRLSNTEWFSSVFVQPDISHIGEGELLPMQVTLSPQSKNQIETGIGYSTDIAVKGTLKWKKPWVNSLGHSFDSSLSLSKPEQTVIVGYKIPLEDVLNEYYRFQYGMKYEDKQDTESLETNAVVERHWQLDSGWHRTVYFRFLHENFTQGAQDDELMMLLPGFSFSKVKTSGGSMPMFGNKQSIALEFSDKYLTSRARIFRVLGKSAWIRSLGNNHRGLVRLDASANVVDDVKDVPPSIRFFAGGDNSLRGYDYESISPTDETGALIGAKFMASSTLEYQYRLVDNWWMAAFVDYGDAWNETADLKMGTGFGVRWASPVGPIRLDFAWGLAEVGAEQFKIHFTLGPEL